MQRISNTGNMYLIQYESTTSDTQQYWMIARSPEQAGRFVTALMSEHNTIKLVRRISVLPEEKEKPA